MPHACANVGGDALRGAAAPLAVKAATLSPIAAMNASAARLARETVGLEAAVSMRLNIDPSLHLFVLSEPGKGNSARPGARPIDDAVRCVLATAALKASE